MGAHLKRIASEEYKMEMTPLIDVTFLLLIFFLLTIKFKLLEGKLSAYLPKDVGVNTSQAEPIEKVEIKIVVDEPMARRRPSGELVIRWNRGIRNTLAAFPFGSITSIRLWEFPGSIEPATTMVPSRRKSTWRATRVRIGVSRRGTGLSPERSKTRAMPPSTPAT